jgi:hypothetical protein
MKGRTMTKKILRPWLSSTTTDQLGKYGVHFTTWSMKQIGKPNGKFSEIGLDFRVQRKGDAGVLRGGGWKIKQAREYVRNFIDGACFNRVLVCDIEACLDFAEKQGDTYSVEYFTEWKEAGFKYLSVDGNNSTCALYYFYTNEIAIDVSEKRDGLELHKINDLHEDNFDDIADIQRMSVAVLNKISADDYALLFRLLQEGKPLNAQQKRQARLTPLADAIRNWAAN